MPSETGPFLRWWRGEWSRAKLLVLLVCVWALLVPSQLTPCLKMDTDTGAYLTLARSIADGRGYMLGGVACRFFPPFFPLMLSAAALSDSEGCELHLENTAGAGGTLGRSFGELAGLIEAAGGGKRLGVCLDSCHLLASG